MFTSIWPVLITALLGLATTLAMGGIKAVSSAVQNLSPMTKQVVVLGIAGLLRVIGGLLGLELPGSLEELTPAIVGTIIAAIAAFGFKGVKDAVKGS